MNSYQVKISNGKSWLSTEISREFIVFAGDMTAALMEATEETDKLKAALISKGLTRDKIGELVITSIHVQSEVAGRTSSKLLDHYGDGNTIDPNGWAERAARSVLERMK